jgi:nucleotidyltransferase/DNA polymerase involved in DNA repair
MKNRYSIDLAGYSLQKFRNNLAARDMIPSRISLKDDLDARFKILAAHGISNLQELIDRLGSKEKIEAFSKETGLTPEYLTLLKREAKSYLSNPVRLDKFSGIPKETLDKLDALGIRNTRQLFNQAQKREAREQIADSTGIPIENLNELVGLSDLSRAYGVGPVFARMIYDLGITSILSFIQVSADEFIRIYEEQAQKKADFGTNEIEFSLILAKELELAVDV